MPVAPLPPGQVAWLAWESKDHLTFLVLNKGEKPLKRLLTLRREQVKTIEIIAYKPIFRTLFSPQQLENDNDKHK